MTTFATGHICQSCGMPISSAQLNGTNADNTPSPEYCCFCYKEGEFKDNLSMDEKIAESVYYHDEKHKVDGRTMTRDEMAVRMRLLLPTLHRWQQHEVTHKAYFKAVNRALEYINSHLDESITLYCLAQVAGISDFHFHRLFRAVMRESPGEYIQRLRLEKASYLIQTTNQTLADIAGQTGYQSHHALSKVFRKRFGLSPSEFRRHYTELCFVVRPVENLKIEPRIVELDPKKVLCIRSENPVKYSDALSRAWNKLDEYIVRGHFLHISGEEKEYITISRDVSVVANAEYYHVYACIGGFEGMKSGGKVSVQEIEGGTYAVFRFSGPYADFDKVYCYIYRYWLPRNKYELRDIPFFEKYLSAPADISSDDLLADIYVPVEKIKER